MAKSIKHIINKVKSKFNISKVPYQILRNNIPEKVKLILPLLNETNCKSVLDVGCNAGELNRELSQDFFSVGIDQKLELNGIKDPLKDVCLGEIKMTVDNVKKIPVFDAVCLFGVHHQWHKRYGKEKCEELVLMISEKAEKVFFIQFAGLNRKYQDNSRMDLFKDNDEESIRNYSEGWLGNICPDKEIYYLGKTPETRIEPFRYMFAVKK